MSDQPTTHEHVRIQELNEPTIEPPPRTDYANMPVEERLSKCVNLLFWDNRVGLKPIDSMSSVAVVEALMEALGEPETLFLEDGQMVEGWLK